MLPGSRESTSTTSIMAVKFMDSSGNAHTSDLISGMDWTVSAKQAGVNVRVVNDSITTAGTPFSQALSDEIDLLTSNDVLFVTAAGNTAENNDTTPRYPCSYNRPGEICGQLEPMKTIIYGTTQIMELPLSNSRRRRQIFFDWTSQ